MMDENQSLETKKDEVYLIPEIEKEKKKKKKR